jgi:seryl-tRNA synthetase
MLDMRLIREDPEKIESLLKKRDDRITLGELTGWDRDRRALIAEIDTMRGKRNEASLKISQLKKEGELVRSPKKEVDRIVQEMNGLREEIREKERKLEELDGRIKDFLLRLPNIPDDAVPAGKSEKDNKVLREQDFGRKPAFEPKPHWDIGETLGILDFERASRISGPRFAIIRGAGCRLERALITFMLDLHLKKGYREILAPYLVKKETMTGTGQLPKFEEELFKCPDDELYLIPTAEVSVTNMHADEILDESELPKKYVSYSACFRREAGSYGKDTRGLIRNHQFDKVELVKLVKPGESEAEHEALTADAEEVLRQLQLRYRVIELCTGDLGFGAARTYDLEVWMEGEKRWREISSCTNFRDFQARRMNTKYKTVSGEKIFVNTINGSGVAAGRLFAAILENYQNAKGWIEVPAALVPYMKTEKIEKE